MNGYDSICCFRSKIGNASARLLWELNTTCNLRCSFCHTTGQYQNSGRTFEEIKSDMIALKDIPISGIIFSGGEPLLRPDIIDILRQAASMGYDVDLCTNATLVNDAISKDLASCLSEVSVSFDSSDPYVHDRLRGVDGAQQLAARGISALRDAGLTIHAITVVNRHTFPSLKSTIMKLEELGAGSVTLLGQMSVEKGIGHCELEFTDNVRAVVKMLRKNSLIPVNTKRIFFEPSNSQCPAGKEIFGMDVGGQLLPCILMKGVAPGLKSINRQIKFEALRQQKCMSCLSYSTCAGGCPGAALLAKGKLDIDPLCSNKTGG